MSHACLCDKSSCTSLHRGVWRFLSWSTAMMSYPNCLTASESFALPAHIPQKQESDFPLGPAVNPVSQQKRRPARTLNQAEDPLLACHFGKNLN